MVDYVLWLRMSIEGNNPVSDITRRMKKLDKSL